jgi:integrase
MPFKIRPYKRGGFEYDLRVELPNGQPYRERKRAPGKTETDAEKHATKRERELIRNGLPDKRGPAPRLAEFAPEWLKRYSGERRLKIATQSRYASILDAQILPRIGHLRLDEIGALAASELLAGLREYSYHHRAGAKAVLKQLLRAAVRWEILSEMPIREMPREPRPPDGGRWHTEAEYQKLVTAARGLPAPSLLAVLLGGEAGLRPGEVLALRWVDVDLVRGLVSVRQTAWHGHVGSPKGGRERHIPMTPALRAALEAVGEGDRVGRVVHAGGAPLGHRALAGLIERTERAAGLPPTGRAHTLRHTFCSRLASRGAPARAIQQLAGHASLAMTQRYMHLSPAEVNTAIALLGGDVGETAGDGSEKKKD